MRSPLTTEGSYKLEGKRVYVAGHRGMVGSALCRRLSGEVILQTAGHHQLDLRRQAEVEEWFAAHRPQAVFVAAAKVGGISANSKLPADFLYFLGNMKFTVAFVSTSIGAPLRRYGLYFHCLTASSAVWKKFAGPFPRPTMRR